MVLIFIILFSFCLAESLVYYYLWHFTLIALCSALSWTHLCLLQLWTALVVQVPGNPNFSTGCVPIILAGLLSPSPSSRGIGGLRATWSWTASQIAWHFTLFICLWIIVETKERRAFVLLKLLRVVCDVGSCTAFRESKLRSHMSAKSGQKKSVIPIQTQEHQYQQYVQTWSYLKPGHSVFSAKLERAEGVCYAKHVGHTNILPKSISNLLQSARSLNFRPELCSVPAPDPITSPGTSLANPNMSSGQWTQYLDTFWALLGGAWGREHLPLSNSFSSIWTEGWPLENFPLPLSSSEIHIPGLLRFTVIVKSNSGYSCTMPRTGVST